MRPVSSRSRWGSVPAGVHSGGARSSGACRANGRTTNVARPVFRLGAVFDRVYLNSNVLRLAGPEGDDAAHRIVRRHADGDVIPRNNLDSEAAHPAAQLGKHFMAGVALHAIQA